jgi:hypothetical protein
MTRWGRWVVALVAVGFAADVGAGRSALLVRPWFAPALLVTAALLALVAVRVRVRLTTASAFLLCLPVAVGITLTPAVAARITPAPADASTVAGRLGDPANPLLQGHGGPVTLLQIVLAEREVGGVVLAGLPVQLDAVVGGPEQLRRSVIVCCAADAQTVSIDARGAALPPSGQWVHVTGRLVVSGTHTSLELTSVHRIDPPGDPFL